MERGHYKSQPGAVKEGTKNPPKQPISILDFKSLSDGRGLGQIPSLIEVKAGDFRFAFKRFFQ
jgi:hypothetical protein